MLHGWQQVTRLSQLDFPPCEMVVGREDERERARFRYFISPRLSHRHQWGPPPTRLAEGHEVVQGQVPSTAAVLAGEPIAHEHRAAREAHPAANAGLLDVARHPDHGRQPLLGAGRAHAFLVVLQHLALDTDE